MFSLGDGTKFWLYSKPTDMRKNFNMLSGIVNNHMGKNLYSGDVFVFINASNNMMKLLRYEPGGLVIYKPKAHVLACDYVQVDESTLPVIDNERHRAVKGYVWSVVDVMAGDRFFFYEHGSRSTRVAMGLLKDFEGAIQSDGYCVYEHFEGMEGKLLLGCWAHARRKFFEARMENEKLADEALFYIGRLYDVEREADALDEADRKPDYERRKALREEKAYPEIKKFETWMEVNLMKCPPRARLLPGARRKACRLRKKA